MRQSSCEKITAKVCSFCFQKSREGAPQKDPKRRRHVHTFDLDVRAFLPLGVSSFLNVRSAVVTPRHKVQTMLHLALTVILIFYIKVSQSVPLRAK